MQKNITSKKNELDPQSAQVGEFEIFMVRSDHNDSDEGIEHSPTNADSPMATTSSRVSGRKRTSRFVTVNGHRTARGGPESEFGVRTRAARVTATEWSGVGHTPSLQYAPA